MKNNQFVLMLLLLVVVSACNNSNLNEAVEIVSNKPSLVDGRYNVAFLVMDGTFNTELTAPYDIFQHTKFREGIKAMNVFTIAKTTAPIITFEGLKIVPDFSYLDEILPDIDILVVPSAEHHLDTDLNDIEMLDFVKSVAKNAEFVTSHCDGAFVLAEAGLLIGVESTTFPGDIELYRNKYPDLIVHDSVYFVHDGKFITSNGGAKSFEAALYLTEYLYGKSIADSLAKGLVINWNLSEVPHLVIE